MTDTETGPLGTILQDGLPNFGPPDSPQTARAIVQFIATSLCHIAPEYGQLYFEFRDRLPAGGKRALDIRARCVGTLIVPIRGHGQLHVYTQEARATASPRWRSEPQVVGELTAGRSWALVPASQTRGVLNHFSLRQTTGHDQLLVQIYDAYTAQGM